MAITQGFSSCCHEPKTVEKIMTYYSNIEISLKWDCFEQNHINWFFVLFADLVCMPQGCSGKRAQRLINLEIPVLLRSLKSSNVELG